MLFPGASGAPEWAVQMAARLMYSAEYKLDYETLLELEKVVETSSNVTHFMSVSYLILTSGSADSRPPDGQQDARQWREDTL